MANHFQEAEKLLEKVGPAVTSKAEILALAQAHATLALVDMLDNIYPGRIG